MKGSEAMTDGMTNAEFNAFLETLAKLIESKAQTPAEAADIVRQAKAEEKGSDRRPSKPLPNPQKGRAESLTSAALHYTRVRRQSQVKNQNLWRNTK